MSWKGISLGAWIGAVFGGGPLGAILGAVIGQQVEKRFFGNGGSGDSEVKYGRRRNVRTAAERQFVFCASAAAMFAKLAKADGRVTSDEIGAVEGAFDRLGFSGNIRKYCIDAFRRAKEDSHTIYEYADEFAGVVDSVELRELFYELLWDLARADGSVSHHENVILRNLPRYLRIRVDWYTFYASRRTYGAGAESAAQERTERMDPYAVLGVDRSASLEEIRRAYRAAAKKCHPDALRAQGLPEEMIGRATEKMSRINAAWEEIKRSRTS